MNKKIPGFVWILIIIVGVIGGIVALKMLQPSPHANKTTREVALTCTTDMATKFHIHPYLKIFINGKPEVIPANIGIQPTCMTSLHTHDDSGKLHVESPEKRDFSLADFFAVWQKPFDKNHLLSFTADTTHRLRQTVNGQESLDFENTILRDDDEIVLYYEEIK